MSQLYRLLHISTKVNEGPSIKEDVGRSLTLYADRKDRTESLASCFESTTPVSFQLCCQSDNHLCREGRQKPVGWGILDILLAPEYILFRPPIQHSCGAFSLWNTREIVFLSHGQARCMICTNVFQHDNFSNACFFSSS